MDELNMLIYYFVFCHLYCCIITFYREIYEGSMSSTGQTMRSLEIVGILVYYLAILTALNVTTNWLTLTTN